MPSSFSMPLPVVIASVTFVSPSAVLVLFFLGFIIFLHHIVSLSDGRDGVCGVDDEGRSGDFCDVDDDGRPRSLRAIDRGCESSSH